VSSTDHEVTRYAFLRLVLPPATTTIIIIIIIIIISCIQLIYVSWHRNYWWRQTMYHQIRPIKHETRWALRCGLLHVSSTKFYCPYFFSIVHPTNTVKLNTKTTLQ